MKPGAGPLQGIRIVDMSVMLLGPYATQMLGDLGADVIKVEPLDGDGRRSLGPHRHAAMASQFLNVNRGKRSIALDLKQPAARDVLLRLCTTADVFVHNSRRAAVKRLMLDYDHIRRVNPAIVYCSAAGFGADGPYSDKPAYDDMIQGLAAIPALQRKLTGTPQYVPMNLSDRNCGLVFTSIILAALLHRERTGEGQAVELPMFETMADFVLSEHQWGRVFEPPIAPMGAARLFERKPSPTRDGYICYWIGTDQQSAALFDVIGRPELKQDTAFRLRADRNRNLAAFYAAVDLELAKCTTAEWMPLLAAADIPAMPMHTLESLMDDPHLKATGFFETVEHPSEGKLVMSKVVTRWSKSQPGRPGPAPRLGEHTMELLTEAGYSTAEIEAMLEAGVLRAAKSPARAR